MRIVLPFVIVASLLALSGCIPGLSRITGSGRIVTRDFDLAGFDSVAAASGFQVDVKAGPTFAVAVSADDSVFDHLNVVKQGTVLNLGLKPNISLSNVTLRATVTMPSLVAATTSGGARLTFAAFKVDSFRAETSGGSTMEGTITASGPVSVRQSGGSRITLSGSAGGLDLNGSGGGRIDLSNLKAGSAQVSLSGGVTAAVQAGGRLDYDLSGGSHLDYAGGPQLGSQKTSGGASATAR